MSKRKDLTGQKFNKYTFIEYKYMGSGSSYWLCQCDCGTQKIVAANKVKSGHTKSCGCLPCRRPDDLTGQKFNMLLFLEYRFTTKGKSYWLCRCDCGTECVLSCDTVKRGKTKSCGCLKRENLINNTYNRLLVRDFYETDKFGNATWLCRCICGKELIVTTGSLKSGHTTSCGCYKKEMIGNKHPCWRHDLTDDERLENKNRKYCPRNRKWREKVLKRDNYTCQCCTTVRLDIQVHHIYNYSTHKKLRYVTSNGVSLCKDCHKRFHKEYGYGNNTRKQFNKFKKDYHG